MPGLDALPADQRAVLRLVLREGRSYDDIARTLRLDPDAVRRRAHAGLATLVAPGAVAEPDRAQVADWILGQDAAEPQALREDRATRDWAAALADELGSLADGELPAVPPGPAPEPATTATAETTAPRQTTTPAGARPSSRRGGAILLAALALAGLVVAVVLLTGGGDGEPSSSTTASAAASATTTSAPDTRVLAQVNLRPPGGAPAAKALGVVQIVAVSGRQAINAIVQGLPQTKKAGYGIWLLGDAGRRQWLGYFRNVDQQGRLVAQGQLDSATNVTSFRRMSVTRETAEPPRRPGTTYLAGAIATPQTQGLGSGASPGG